MKRKNVMKKGTAWLLTAALLVGLLPIAGTPTTVQAQNSETTETTVAKTIAGLGTSMIADPTVPSADSDEWKGSYVYFGNYDADGNENKIAEATRYRVLDANTTRFSADDADGNKAETMLLDSDKILYYQKFDEDGKANEGYTKANDWAGSDVKVSLNGKTDKEGNITQKGFIDEAFTTVEKSAIVQSTIAAHALTDSTEGGAVNVASWTKSGFANYVPLTGEKIFLLDAEDVSNNAYGYSTTDKSCGNRAKLGSGAACWWLRSACTESDNDVGYVDSEGAIDYDFVGSDVPYGGPGVSPALNLNLSSVIFTSVISGISGEIGAEYKLTLKDSNMSIAPGSGVTKSGNKVTIPYTISGTNSGNATQVSVLVLDKEYTAGNTNGAKVLDYQKLSVDSFSTSGSGTYTLPSDLSGKMAGTDYHVYILAEDVNDEKETDYASEPVEIHLWEAPTVSAMNFGTDNIIDPAKPNHVNDEWTGCYVYYGNYDADGNENKIAEATRYRVLDANTTRFSADDADGNKAETMLLDSDKILYYQKFDEDGKANEGYTKANDWAGSDVKVSLNGKTDKEGNKTQKGFIDEAFTTVEESAIAQSTIAAHALTTDSTEGGAVNVDSWTKSTFANYVPLTGEKIFLLDAEDVSNNAYGYSTTENNCGNRKKSGSGADYWWLRSAGDESDSCVGNIYSDGLFNYYSVSNDRPGVSPALNLNLSSVIFTSANAVSKSSPLTSESEAVGTTTGTEWKLTLKDSGKKVALTEERNVTKASDGTITVPYTYMDTTATETATDASDTTADDAEAVNQISVMITDTAYDCTKTANEQEAKILYYGALDSIKNENGDASKVTEATSGTGTFSLPKGLADMAMGIDYHIYLLAEHVNTDDTSTTGENESMNTDYASEPLEVTTILDEIDTVAIPSVDIPTPEQAFATEITTSSNGVAEKATLTWKKVTTGDSEKEATGNAEWKNAYNAYVTLTAKDGYTFKNAMGKASVSEVKYNGNAVDEDKITLNEDGTLTACVGKLTTATRKTIGVTALEVPEQFANYYTEDTILNDSSTNAELNVPAKVTLEGTTTPNPVDMAVTWKVVDTDGNDATYDPTPEATNTFRWTVNESEYKDKYDVSALTAGEQNPFTGTVTIKNKDYTPVTITGKDTTVTYDGSKTLDVSKYFTIDKNAGTATYELQKTSTGKGSITGDILTIESTGIFVIRVNTPIKGVYNKGEHTLTLTIEKAESTIVVAPTVADRTYHPNVTLRDEDLITIDAKVVGKKEETLNGTWSVKKVDGSNPIPQANNDGYTVVFTPDEADAIFYTAVESIVKVNVAKATPHIREVPSAKDITYGEVLGDSVLSGGVVTYGESGNETDLVEVEGTFTWKKDDTTDPAAIKPTVADSEKTEYTVIFTPEDTGYNTVETKITLTVNKAAVAPSVDTNVTSDDGTATVAPSVDTKVTSDNGTAAVVPSVDTKLTSDNGIAAVAPSVDTKLTSDDGTATYKIAVSDLTNGEVTYVAPTNKKATTVIISDTVVIDGVTYKVTAVEKNDFKNNKYIKKLIIGNNVKTIGKSAFAGYKKLKTVKFGKNVTTISDKAFYKCIALTEITIPSKVKTIGKSAFEGCEQLKSVTIGKSVTKIGTKAFYGCKALKSINIKTKKLTSKKVGKNAFKGVGSKYYKKVVVEVPSKKYVNKYKKMLQSRGLSKKAKIKK